MLWPAGSENQKTSGAVGDQLKEASNINKSLSALGHVILRLEEAQIASSGRSMHVPYRDSRLTFLLKVSMQGCTSSSAEDPGLAGAVCIC